MEPAQDVSGVNVRALVRYVRARRGDTGVARVLELAGEDQTAPGRYEDLRRWWPHPTMVRLFAAAAEVLEDERVAFGIGASILQHTGDTALRVAFGLLGGPAQVFRIATKASGKFTRAGRLTALGYGHNRVLLRYQNNPGFPANRWDCDYAQGLLSQVPCVYGLPPAEVVHHSCAVAGAPACTYEVRWKSRRRFGGRGSRSPVADAMAEQLRNLQLTVAALVGSRHPEQVLATIADRAGSAVNARAFLLVARPGPNQPAQQHSYGLSDAEVAELTGRVPPGEVPGDLGPDTLTAPIASADQTFGYLVAVASEFLDTERDLLHSYANLAAAALDTASALRVAADRQRTTEGLFRLARELTESRTAAEVATVTAGAAAAVMDAQVAAVLLFDEQARLHVVGQYGFPAEQLAALDALAITPGDTGALAARMANPRLPTQYQAGAVEDPFLAELLAGSGLGRMAAVGIAGADRLHGILVTGYIAATEPDIQTEFAERMTGIADQAATALRNCELLDETWQLAYRDALTGLANRRAFTDRLDQGVREGAAGLLFLDLDGFKSVNDTLGHAIGDELLRVTGDRLRGCTRPGDFVARLGGDEFVILLPGITDDARLLEAADRIGETFRRPVTVDGHLIPVRLSIGGTLIGEGYDREEVLQRADRAMYQAKRSRSGTAHLAPAA